MMKAKLYLFAAAVMMVAVFSGCKEDPVAPTVVTKPASGISEGMATLNAEITNQGTDAVTKCGFYYNTSTDMSYPEVVEANAGSSNFSAVISNLEPGKTYYYMAYAKSNAGLAEGEVLSFATQVVKPKVETRAVSEVTTSGATLNAAIPSNGGSAITSCGFYYSTSENMSNKQTAEFSGTPDSLFSVAVSGLQSFTTYYYKAFATNALGSVEGEVMQFTTVIRPSVTTNAATDIYSSSATLNGNVTNHGGTTSTIRGFVYGTSADNLADSVTSGTGSGAYSKSIAGLAPSTTYYFKAFASNSAGTVYGEVKQFATKAAVPPTVQTNAATAITATSATFGGNVTAAGNDPVTVRGFVWGTSSSNLSNNVECGSGTGSFTKEITGLTHSTTYYYKAYATNATGTSYGQIKSFATTTLTAPAVQTNAATSISMTGATLNGNVTADGGATVTARGFVYGTSASNLSQNVQSGTGTGSFTKALTGLSHSTTYYYKAYATNAIGTNYGEVKQFTTSSPSMPTVQTNNASSITSSGATLNGNVTADGGATVTVRGFVYGTSASDLSQNVQSGSGTGSFTKALTGLSHSTTYYYKAYATNAIGTNYGEVKQFTTSSPSMPTVLTNAASSISMRGATLNGNVTDDGDATVTVRGFMYGTSASNLSQTVESGNGTGSYTANLTNLSDNTTYYYKAYATNSVGTSYGEVLSFTTYGISDPTGYTNGHGYVDLGLPSGTMWAYCNIGATNPEDYGNYYAWGETSTKTTYNSSTYTYTGNPTTLPSSADAATANWGSAWRMPTKEEFEELKNNCTITYTYVVIGVGYLARGNFFTGPNGNSIFLPAAGCRFDSDLSYDNNWGRYWSSSLRTDYQYPNIAWFLDFTTINCNLYSINRNSGLTVRPVCVSQN